MSEAKSCEHLDEADISTYGDAGCSIQTLVCLHCGETRETPYDWAAHFGLTVEPVAP
jgi:hypothetical protein